jgi:hypothetical protein
MQDHDRLAPVQTLRGERLYRRHSYESAGEDTKYFLLLQIYYSVNSISFSCNPWLVS